MDAYTVQAHIADWLNAGGIPGLDKAHPALEDSQDLNTAAYGSGTMRCQAVVYTESEMDVRRSTPVHYGIRQVRFGMRLEIGHRSAEPNWQAADQALKRDVVNGIKKMLRTDPQLGTAAMPEPLFNSAGEGPRGVQVEYDEPFVDDDTGEREQWAFVRFDVLSFETA